MEPMTLDFIEEVRNLVKHYQKFQTSVVCVFGFSIDLFC